MRLIAAILRQARASTKNGHRDHGRQSSSPTEANHRHAASRTIGASAGASARKFSQLPPRLPFGVLPSPVVPVDVQPAIDARTMARTTILTDERLVMSLT
jgi:hypothetical protein